MRRVLLFLFFAILSVASARVFAQARYDVSGIVLDEKGEPVKTATVFIGGSDRVMPTDEDGRFKFTGVSQGSFQLSVKMLGFTPLTRNIVVQGAPVKVNLQLTVKTNVLNEVKIGNRRAVNINLRLFKEAFLGTSANGKQCEILNPEILSFNTKKGLLLAEADDFLIIENKRLGYSIHYLLKDFGYSTKNNTALYHGDFSFEELPGSDDDKKKWARNRAETYQGSFMHFLRSAYTNTALENGFITRQFYGNGTFRYNPDIADPDLIVVKDHPVKFDTLITAIDTNLASLKFKQLYVVYDPKKATTYYVNTTDKKKTVVIDKKGSIVKLSIKEAIIDQKGSYTDYRAFYITGYWGIARVGDQLPVEYQPPFTPVMRRDNAVDKLTIALQKWTDSIPQEKVYLHMDKPHYAPGDTIWFKGYLTIGSKHELSALSGAVYADLLDDQDQLIRGLKLPVGAGMVAGNFILNDDLPEGSYHIRAYTRWMQNAGPDYFFNKSFNVGDPAKAEKKKETKPIPQQADVQFFPESGNLVNGLSSRVAFKAIGANGLGTAISGKVTDSDNNELAGLTTLHAGMGNFLLKPQPGKTYKANISFADGSTKSISLPKVLDTGYVLSVYQPVKDSILVRIQASATLQQSKIILIAQSSGETIFASSATINGANTSLWFDRKSFPSGIAQFTIFGADNEPLNERIVFIKGDDKMRLAVKTEKAVYKSKEHIELDLNANNGVGQPTSGNFSVAVIDASQIPVEESAESTIFSNILLTSDIKGYVERPNYYFTSQTDTVNTALDNLMLTQGYRRFEWNTINATINTKPAFEPEGLGSAISGTVTGLDHKPSANATVKLLSIRAGLLKDTVTDANGRFKFDWMFIADSIKFTIQARDANNSNKVRIEIDTAPEINFGDKQNPKNANATTDQVKTHQQQVEQEGQIVKLNQLHTLKQVDILAKKKPKLKDNITDQQIFAVPEGSADKIITIPDPQNYNTLTMVLQARLPGINIEIDELGLRRLVSMRPPVEMLATSDATDKFAGREIGLIVDGRKIRNTSEVDEMLEGGILVEDIAKIEVVRTNMALINALKDQREGFVGYVLLITKPYTSRKRYYPSIANIMPKGFNKTRKFYSPRYDAPADNYKQPDLRTTIYWNPYLQTDINGKATLDFYNGDGPGTYRIVVEGINTAGELGRQVYTYKVE
ncbi:MAG: carboxypeptidase regulatory-like domain-containing protein [Bacteroidota bacterium]